MGSTIFGRSRTPHYVEVELCGDNGFDSRASEPWTFSGTKRKSNWSSLPAATTDTLPAALKFLDDLFQNVGSGDEWIERIIMDEHALAAQCRLSDRGPAQVPSLTPFVLQSADSREMCNIESQIHHDNVGAGDLSFPLSQVGQGLQLAAKSSRQPSG